jgi:hypothetical protein
MSACHRMMQPVRSPPGGGLTSDRRLVGIAEDVSVMSLPDKRGAPTGRMACKSHIRRRIGETNDEVPIVLTVDLLTYNIHTAWMLIRQAGVLTQIRDRLTMV